MLLEIVERRSPITNRKSVVYRLQCDACGALIESSKCRYERGKYHCCNNKCVSKHRREHPELYPDSTKSLNSAKSHAKAKATIQQKAAKGQWRHWLGKKHSEETKRHLSEVSKGGVRSGKNNGMFGRAHSEETRSKMSDAKTRLILEGKFRAYGTNNKKGWYTSTKTGQACFFRSSWEEQLMQHLDSNSDVIKWEYETLRIPYNYNDHKRWYVPDFLVTRVDGSRQLIEVKPKEFVESERVRLKSEAAREWCSVNGANYVIATRQLMNEWGIYPS